MPSTAECLDERDARIQPDCGELSRGALGEERRALRVDDFKVGNIAGIVTHLRKRGGTSGGAQRTLLRGRLLGEKLRGGQRVLHFAEGDKHPLTKRRD